MKTYIHTVTLLVACVSATVAHAQIAIVKGKATSDGEVSADAKYVQNFDALPSASSTKPDKAEALDWKNNVTLRGWFRDVNFSKGDFSASGAYTDAPAFFNYGLDGKTNRSIGFRNTQGNERDAAAALVFQNKTGAPIKAVTIAYTGRQWRKQSDSPSSLVVGWRVVGGKEFNPDTLMPRHKQWWRDVPELTFTAPQLSGANVVNGTAPDCMKKFEPFTVTFTRAIYPNEFFALRWYYPTNAKNTGNGLALDDVEIGFVK